MKLEKLLEYAESQDSTVEGKRTVNGYSDDD